MRTIRYKEIADHLRRQIEAGELVAGQVLPSEAGLGATHEASRVTIRKALELLRDDGLVESRQGFGWMVSAEPFTQPLDALVSVEAQLAGSGLVAERRILDFKFVDAPADVVEVLGPRVLEVRRVNLADRTPFSRVTVWCREDLGADLSKAQVARSSFYDLLPVRVKEATQTIGARLMTDADGDLLGVPAGSPALLVRRITFAEDGEAVLVSEHAFPGHLTEFAVRLQQVEAHDASAPRGLRLVE